MYKKWQAGMFRCAILFIGLFLTTFSYGQMNVNNQSTPDSMVNLLIGEGVTVMNVTYTGSSNQSGTYFFSPLGSLPVTMFDEGIILSSGQSTAAVGPNGSAGTSNNMGTGGDPDLQMLSGYNINDANILEFDFIPESSVVEFRYVFGSDEYHEYVDQFNDAFGFFISGPGITGPYMGGKAKNIAVIPFSMPPSPVVIDSVNWGSAGAGQSAPGPWAGDNPEYFLDNTPCGSADTCMEYDGRTVVLTAFATVTPCQTYHIKLAVGDAVDGLYDSGVFLEANSFSSVGIQGGIAYASPYIDTIAVENCNNATLSFGLDDHALEDIDIPLEFLDCTFCAVNGVDYDTIPDTLTIQQGFKEVSVDIIPFEDGIPEGFEFVKIRYNTSLCEPNYDTLTFRIYDKPDFNMYARDDTLMHCEDSVRLFTNQIGGMQPYFWAWSTGDSTHSIWVDPLNPTEYTVQVWDACGDTIMDTIFVDIVGPTAWAGNDTSICENDYATLTCQGGTSWEWSNGETTQTIQVNPLTQTTYWVNCYDECNNFDSDTVIVYVANPQAFAGEDTEICIGHSTTLTGGGGTNYFWFGTINQQSITVSPLQDTIYWVEVFDDCGNSAIDSVWVFVNDGVVATTSADTAICIGGVATLTGWGGVDYTWSTGETTQTINVDPTTTTTYWVEVYEGCADTGYVTVTVNPLPVIEATTDDPMICWGDSVYLHAIGGDSYVWEANPPDASLIGQETEVSPYVSPRENTVYTLVGTNAATTCENTTAVGVIVKDSLKADFVSNQPGVCELEDMIFSYTGNAGGGANYDWNFDGGVVSGGGPGPVSVHWTTAGMKYITLQVTEDGCESVQVLDSIEVNILPKIAFSVTEESGCVPYTVILNDESTDVLDGAVYTWNFSDGGSTSDTSYTFTQTGTYDVSLTIDNNGCIDTQTQDQLVQVNPNPEANYSHTPTVTTIDDSDISFTDGSSADAVQWDWDFGDGNIGQGQNVVHVYADTGTFFITLAAFNQYGCVDSITKEVTIKPTPHLFMPNAFTPNGDGVNDKFYFVGSGIEEFKMQVFNRWGQLIFETKKLGDGWDGTIKGQDATSGTYLYVVTYRDNIGRAQDISGEVTLIR